MRGYLCCVFLTTASSTMVEYSGTWDDSLLQRTADASRAGIAWREPCECAQGSPDLFPRQRRRCPDIPRRAARLQAHAEDEPSRHHSILSILSKKKKVKGSGFQESLSKVGYRVYRRPENPRSSLRRGTTCGGRFLCLVRGCGVSRLLRAMTWLCERRSGAWRFRVLWLRGSVALPFDSFLCDQIAALRPQ